MRDLDLKSLRLLVSVCDHQNIKAAAVQERIEPSAISRRIARLEASVGTPLLVRGRRGVQPTPAGAALLEHARTLLFTVQRIDSDVAAFKGGVEGHMRVVASVSAIAESLLDDVAAFMREPAHRLEHRPYRRDELVLAVPAGHPLAGKRNLRFEQTLDHEHVGLHPPAAMHTMLHRAAARCGRTPTYRGLVSNFDAALRVVAAELAISVIPRQVCQSQAAAGAIKVVPLTDDWAQRSFALCFRDAATLSPAAANMVDYLARRAGAAEQRQEANS